MIVVIVKRSLLTSIFILSSQTNTMSKSLNLGISPSRSLLEVVLKIETGHFKNKTRCSDGISKTKMQVTFKLLFDFEDLLTALEDLSQETTDKLILLNQQSILLQCYFLLLRNHDKIMCNNCSWNSPSRVNEGKSRFIIRTY